MKGAPLVPFQALYLEPSRNGLMRPKRVRGAGFKMINMGELFAHDRIKNPPMDLVPMTASEIDRFGIRQWDLVFARQSLVADGAGKCSIVLQVPEVTTFESHLIRVRLNPAIADPLYYYYYFQSPAGKGNVQSIVMQVAAAGIRASELATLPVPKPNLARQRRIASILSAYDDLIENNTRRIAILEEMARRIYEEWFVRFRFPGHDGVRMVESELGCVPAGWEVMALGDIVDDIVDYRGKTPAKLNGEWSSKGILALSALNIKRGRLVNLEKSRSVSEDLYARWMKNPLQRGDILMTSEAPLGELFFHQSDQRYCLSQRTYSIRANRQIVKPVILYLSLDSKGTQDELASRATGATVSGIRQSELRKVPIVVAPMATQIAVEPVLADLMSLAAKLDSVCTNLRMTRDLLLPKLISGELDVSAMPEPEALAA